MELPEIKLEITGKAETNLADYKTKALEVIAAINTKLNTDQDFTLAKTNIKEIKAAEDSLKQLKADSLKSVKSIYEAFALIDEIDTKLRVTRLDLNRVVTKREKERRDELIKEKLTKVNNFIDEIIGKMEYQSINFPSFEPMFSESIKGKKTITGCEKALNEALINAVDAIESKVSLVNFNYKTFQTLAKDKEHYFNNIREWLTKSQSEFETLIKLKLLEIEKAEKEIVEKKPEVIQEKPLENKTIGIKESIGISETITKQSLNVINKSKKIDIGEGITFEINDYLPLAKKYFNFVALFDDIEAIKKENFLLSDSDLVKLLAQSFPGIIFKIGG